MIMAHQSPGRLLLLSFGVTIFLGTFLLALPFARVTSIPLIDILFTAISSTCLSGLYTIPLDAFTMFGQAIIMLLMQIGAIGLITMTIYLLSFFVDLGLGTQLVAGQILELDSWNQVRKVIKFINMFALMAEGIGALCILFFTYNHNFSFFKNVFWAMFHAVSFFSNTGVTLFPGDLVGYQHSYAFLTVGSLLILSGGLGFVTWYELARYIKTRMIKKRAPLSLNAKIILYGTASLLTLTTALFLLLEWNASLAGMNFVQMSANALFNGIGGLGSGFFTVDVHSLREPTRIALVSIAMVAAVPGAPGGGIRITTFAILLATIKTAIKNRESVEIRGRKIAEDQVYKAIAITFFSLACIVISSFILLLSDPTLRFFDLILEITSAFSTLGISHGVSEQLSTFGKIIILINTLIGRVGALTLIMALRTQKEAAGFSYPEERVMFT